MVIIFTIYIASIYIAGLLESSNPKVKLYCVSFMFANQNTRKGLQKSVVRDNILSAPYWVWQVRKYTVEDMHKISLRYSIDKSLNNIFLTATRLSGFYYRASTCTYIKTPDILKRYSRDQIVLCFLLLLQYSVSNNHNVMSALESLPQDQIAYHISSSLFQRINRTAITPVRNTYHRLFRYSLSSEKERIIQWYV